MQGMSAKPREPGPLRHGEPDPVRRRGLLVAGLASIGFGLAALQARGAYMVKPWAAGRPVPKLELNDLSGKPWSLAALRGQPVVMNFWATWCEPCRSEMPSLELMAQRHEKDGLVVLAVNYQEPIPAIKRFLETQLVTLPILLDRDGEATTAWTPRVFPTTVLIDRQGQPQSLVLGEMDWGSAEARRLVQALIDRPKTA
jgi:thiol-disulfide isomerase/thioredoxin